MASQRAEAYHNLAVMLDSGVPLGKAIETVGRGHRGALKRGLAALARGVSRGDTLAETMRARPEIFEPLDVLAVDVAETSGRLPEALRMLGEWYAMRHRVTWIAVSGVMLPAIILHIAAFVAPLPAFVLGSVRLGAYLASAASILALFYVPAAVIFAVVKFTPKTGPLRRVLDRVTLVIPILGAAVRQLALARFFHAFGMLYRTGAVPMADCVERSADVCGNDVVRGWVIGGAAVARAGQPVSAGLSPSMPPEIRSAWDTGEESGKLDETSARLARNAGANAEHLFTLFGAWLPRVVYFLVMILMIVLIFRAFSAYVAPMYKAME